MNRSLDRPDNRGRVPPGWRLRVARRLWVLLAVVVWNVVMDVQVQQAATRYLAAQQRYELGHGPRQSIAAWMEPAARDGFRRATLWSGLVAAVGLGALARAARRSRPERHA